MKRFNYLAPESLEEALEMLALHTDATPLAGGTDLLVQIKEHNRTLQTILSLKRVKETARCVYDNGLLSLGATTTVGAVAANRSLREDFTALASAAGMIGSVQIRNMATIGGNLCNASPSADTAPPLLALNAQAVIASSQGERRVPLEAFFLGPGHSSLQPGELLKALIVPRLPQRSGSYYLRHTPRAWMDIAVVGVAAVITLDDAGAITGAGLGLGAVAPVPMRAKAAEALLIGKKPDDALFRAAGKTAADESSPIDDVRSSAEYRRHLVEILTRRALQGALAQAQLGKGAAR
jgi:carbon-monoxide dehydrogenase medium subunit